MVISNEQLRDILIDIGIEQAKLDELMNVATTSGTPLLDLVVEHNLISAENLGKIVGDAVNVPFVLLSKISTPDEILQIIPESVAKKQKVMAFGRDENGLKLAMVDPSNAELVQLVSQKVGEKVIPYLAMKSDLEDAHRLYRRQLQKQFDDILNNQNAGVEKVAKEDTVISRMVDMIIDYAYQYKASDIHIQPSEEQSVVRFRIDGVLHADLRMPKSLHDQVVTRIKVLSGLRIDEHLSAQDGKVQFHLENEDLDVRISIVPVVEGEKVVMRLLSARARLFTLTDLGMSDQDLGKVTNGFHKPYGMVLSTGPTGSGKTTSVYAILKVLNTSEKNIATIEDPVEYKIDNVSQIQVNAKTNLTFAEGLRAILHQDPDIIFVGEIRDEETASIAINSALTGHLVLSTLHTNDAATALPRLIDMHIDPFLIASTVNVIVGQRLIRKICEQCRYSRTALVSELTKYIPEEVVRKYFGANDEIRFYMGKGCAICHYSGYVGRVGIYEVLEVTDTVKELIISKADSDMIKAKAMEEGMVTMLEDGISKVARGVTTIEEVLRATKV